ncbi:hypothetical protein [Nostoc sp.]|uniref:hypothetical protein n=1 Tax=Nostoc sp. TaxID=1180 RepID=UPI003FA61328
MSFVNPTMRMCGNYGIAGIKKASVRNRCCLGIRVLEVQPPAAQEPIHWRLLTTRVVLCLKQALRVIQWYGWRWKIEQLFATLKLD